MLGYDDHACNTLFFLVLETKESISETDGLQFCKKRPCCDRAFRRAPGSELQAKRVNYLQFLNLRAVFENL